MDKFVIIRRGDESDSDFDENTNELNHIDNSDIQIDKKEIKIIRDFIEKKMNNSQKIQIVDIIKESCTKYTINKNGYFINMNNIPNDILLKIKMFVDFTKENAKELMKTEEILNEEKSRIESIDKIEEETNNFTNVGFEDNLNEKNINFEIYSLDSVQSYIFEEYKDNNDDEIEFCNKMIDNEKRDNSGYKIILKRYKKKYFGNKAKVLKKFRDISRTSINSKSAKTSLNQATLKPTIKNKNKKNASQNIKLEEIDKIEEETQNGCEEYTVEDEEEEEEIVAEYYDEE